MNFSSSCLQSILHEFEKTPIVNIMYVWEQVKIMRQNVKYFSGSSWCCWSSKWVFDWEAASETKFQDGKMNLANHQQTLLERDFESQANWSEFWVRTKIYWAFFYYSAVGLKKIYSLVRCKGQSYNDFLGSSPLHLAQIHSLWGLLQNTMLWNWQLWIDANPVQKKLSIHTCCCLWPPDGIWTS